MSNPRSIGKSLRFSIFARDNFTCRYCGRQSDIVPLVIDHVIPVCKGGTADPENLITACNDCNAGKAGKLIEQAAPTEADRLRMSQERNEQMAAAKSAKQAASARRKLSQSIVNYWCSCTGRQTVNKGTIQVITGYVNELGAELVFKWIEKASAKAPHCDNAMGRYVSGIRRCHLREMK